jgi:4-hydroxy-4-methyl-2-oxoglutarate aldolase
MTDPSARISTAAIADASLRLGIIARLAPVALRPVVAGAAVQGPAAPVTHLGSVDVLLETIDDAPAGAIMVVDNGGRLDEACVGDLMVLEAERAGLAAMVVWGLHRDTAQLVEIGLPVFSLGASPFGPRRVPPAGRRMATAFLDGIAVTSDDHVFADDDGVLVVPADRVDELVEVALEIQRTEQAQAERMRRGESLRSQLDFAGYRERQASNPDYSLRQHLREQGGAIEV